MLSRRILTAAVLAPLLLYALYRLPTSGLAGVLGAVSLVGAWEWTGISGGRRRAMRIGYLLATGACGILLYLTYRWQLPVLIPLMLIAVAWWLWAVYELTRYTAAQAHGRRSLAYKHAAGFLVLLPSWFALVALHGADDRSPVAIVLLLGLVWVADSGAYFAGRTWGRHKLAPRVSPGKTVEGLVGGLCGAAGFALITGYWVWHLEADVLVSWVILCVVVAVFSVIGDLYESMLKRDAGVKDSGHVLPGHGGILDRIDSLCAAAPVYLVGWWWMFSAAS